jgi:hypothetical protein
MANDHNLRECQPGHASLLTWKTLDEARFMDMVNSYIDRQPTHEVESR